MGGGGGSDNYEQTQAATEAKKQAARDALNYQFGIGTTPTTTTYTGTAPNEADYYINGTAPASSIAGGLGSAQASNHSKDSGASIFSTGTLDQDAYNKALADYEATAVTTGGEANPNAAARDTLYQTVRDNSYNAGKRGLDETKDAAGRALKFELFAKGLNGGSEDINQNALLGRTYSNGLLDLGGKADAAKASFKANDESTRLGLLQSIDAGMDQGSALSSATAQLQNNNDQAAAEAQGTTLGDLFANTALISNQSQYRNGKVAGTEWWNNYAPSSSKSSKASTGTITGV